MKNLFKAAVVAALFAGTANADQGVTDNQVLIGSNQVSNFWSGATARMISVSNERPFLHVSRTTC